MSGPLKVRNPKPEIRKKSETRTRTKQWDFSDFDLRISGFGFLKVTRPHWSRRRGSLAVSRSGKSEIPAETAAILRPGRRLISTAKLHPSRFRLKPAQFVVRQLLDWSWLNRVSGRVRSIA